MFLVYMINAQCLRKMWTCAEKKGNIRRKDDQNREKLKKKPNKINKIKEQKQKKLKKPCETVKPPINPHRLNQQNPKKPQRK